MISREVRKRINKAVDEILAEEKKKKELVNRNLDYDFLQVLINRCNDNPGLLMKITLRDGTVIQMATQKHDDSYVFGYDGEPSMDEMEIK